MEAFDRYKNKDIIALTWILESVLDDLAFSSGRSDGAL